MKENGLKIYTIFKNISACLKCFFLNFVILKKKPIPLKLNYTKLFLFKMFFLNKVSILSRY